MRFLTWIFVLSLIVTGGAFAWRSLAPEGPEEPRTAQSEPDNGTRGASPDAQARRLERQENRQDRRQERREASARQDMAVTISIASSIISAIAAMLQAWFSTRR